MSEELEQQGAKPGNGQSHSPEDVKTDNLQHISHISGMYQSWFLDYASYVILERAVPHINDGLKPVQRRILHSMKRLDDGRYNKVANIIGNTMQFHPHGDASIGDALVQLGQKDMLIDCQGNWGNIHTGDGAAAPRYIEARLTKFALDVVFSPKITEWKSSYDGRNQEPVTLPVKFPLLLAQGVEGIAVGLASKILPHNFNELIDACIAHLQGKTFELLPDFPTGGLADCSKYNDGLRGGNVRIRSRIEKLDKKTLVIKDIPFGKNSGTLIESILKANEKGKIKIKKIDDNTAANVEILVHLTPGVSPDKTIDALYAFTDCELSISPNSCVIEYDKPCFIGVSEILRHNADSTKEFLRQELLIRLGELEEQWHMASLEKLFIEERIYKDKAYEDGTDYESVIAHIHKRFEPFKKQFVREITDEDVKKLFEIKMRRILKFSTKEAEDLLLRLEEEMTEVKNHLNNIVEYAINYFRQIKKKYGKGRERKTELRSFENIEAAKVVVANEKLYCNYQEGFIGIGASMRKEEYVCECSDIDDIIVFRKDGKYIITKASDKVFVGKDIQYVGVFKRNDDRTIYNVIYRDGKYGQTYMKRFPVKGITRDKEYDVTKGTEGSRMLYFSANPNGEAETIKIYLKPRPKLKKLIFELNFSDLAIKGRQSMGNILTRHQVHRIVLKESGVSTLGGLKIWFDDVVFRLNTDERGQYLGEFKGNDKILVVTKDGQYHMTNFDISNHYPDDILRIEKYKGGKVFSAVFYDGEQGFYYLKRFDFEDTNKYTSFIGEHKDSKLVLLTDERWPQVRLTYGGKNEGRPEDVIDVDDFIAVKSYKARGKRLSTYEIKKVVEIEPLQKEALEPEPEIEDAGVEDMSDEIDSELPEGDGEQMSLGFD
ncbi:MAG: DNA topoisomerase IV [Bacteroidetes bacterium HGW-Bacteroidetes-4]|jgi:topoisomerase-4 subunit A|nr:MAG: DNA topoisomerase IV [Bacteroidetes bacterium HGW-Bacteroidetes-4]